MKFIIDSMPMTPLVYDEPPDPSELYATHQGALQIGELEFTVYQLSNGKRVMYQLSNGKRVIDADDLERFFPEFTR